MTILVYLFLRNIIRNLLQWHATSPYDAKYNIYRTYYYFELAHKFFARSNIMKLA